MSSPRLSSWEELRSKILTPEPPEDLVEKPHMPIQYCIEENVRVCVSVISQIWRISVLDSDFLAWSKNYWGNTMELFVVRPNAIPYWRIIQYVEVCIYSSTFANFAHFHLIFAKVDLISGSNGNLWPCVFVYYAMYSHLIGRLGTFNCSRVLVNDENPIEKRRKPTEILAIEIMFR